MPDASELFKSAKLHMNEGRLEDALSQFNDALEADPNHVLSHLTLCRLLSQMELHDKAIRHGEKVCQLDDSDPIHFTVLSVTYQRALAATGDLRYMELAERARDRGMGPGMAPQ